MSTLSKTPFDPTIAPIFDHVLPLVPGLVRWLERGIDVLEVGCGRGLALAALARRFPRSHFLGVDFAPDAIAWAREQVAADSQPNLHYEVRDAARMNFVEAFDFIAAFDAIHHQANPARVLLNLARALRVNGVHLIQAPAVAPAAGAGPAWNRDTASRLLATAGFRDVLIERPPHDFQNDYYVARK